MRTRLFQIVFACGVVAAAFLMPGGVFGCSIPVFRYALERWPADPYGAVVFHQGALSEEHEAILTSIRKSALIGDNPSNLEIHPFDVEKPLPKGLESIWAKHKDAELPCMVVLFPMMSDIEEPLWSGGFSRKAVDALVDSPKRREIARRILAGESTVWVLLESGDKAKDEAAATTLTQQLATLQKELELPPQDEPAGPAGGMTFSATQPVTMESTLPLQLVFSTLRVSRDDPAEKTFVDMLMKTEPDLHEYVDEPMVFPVFGRGRALYALVGKGINEMTIGRAAFFLAGACSCEIKAYNPGTDLLMSVGWDAVLRNLVAVEEVLPPLTGLKPFAAPREESQSTTAPAALVETAAIGGAGPSGRLLRNTLVAVIVLVGLVAIAAIVVDRKGQISAG